MIIEKPVGILNEVEKFLKIPQFFTSEHFEDSGQKGYPCFKLDEESRSKCVWKRSKPHPELNEESLNYLRNHFRPIIDNFERQTGMRLNLS